MKPSRDDCEDSQQEAGAPQGIQGVQAGYHEGDPGLPPTSARCCVLGRTGIMDGAEQEN